MIHSLFRDKVINIFWISEIRILIFAGFYLFSHIRPNNAQFYLELFYLEQID